METFIRVVETGSFSGAARQLRVGQPAVSKTVAQLESYLGVRLLTRLLISSNAALTRDNTCLAEVPKCSFQHTRRLHFGECSLSGRLSRGFWAPPGREWARARRHALAIGWAC
jgi:hypothetical protein